MAPGRYLSSSKSNRCLAKDLKGAKELVLHPLRRLREKLLVGQIDSALEAIGLITSAPTAGRQPSDCFHLPTSQSEPDWKGVC